MITQIVSTLLKSIFQKCFITWIHAPRTVRINDNAVKAVTEWAKYPDSMAAITGVKQSTPDALTTIQTARKNKTITQSQLQQIDISAKQ